MNVLIYLVLPTLLVIFRGHPWGHVYFLVDSGKYTLKSRSRGGRAILVFSRQVPSYEPPWFPEVARETVVVLVNILFLGWSRS